ncbi:MAG TPA: hypothetical protein VK638_35535 [Edaphobacter sp.]|nr:hypothetical protein [Edaphobacter sp.]
MARRCRRRAKKRFYRLPGEGERILGLLLAEWNGINDSLGRIVAGKKVDKER